MTTLIAVETTTFRLRIAPRCGTSDWSRPRRMDPEKLLLESLPDLERISAFVCRKSSLEGADAEDFHSWVKLKLIENDYAILRKFEARSTLRTYLAVVVQRLMLDYRNHQLGKWRPSAEAKRLGEVAVTLEMLLHRDRRGIDEAIATAEVKHAPVSRAEIESILQRLPQRPPRRREVALEEIGDGPAIPADEVELRAAAGEAQTLARRTGDVIREAIEAMPDADRLLLRMRFEAGMSVAEIARALRSEAAPLYRRIYRNLDALRSRLEQAGVRADDALRMMDARADLDFGLGRTPVTAVPDEEARA